MRRNSNLWTSGVNLDIAVPFPDPISYYSAKFRRFGHVFRWFLHFICWMSAIFLLPVCSTYWPRKYTTRVDPHVDNSHQVWSWYDHTLPSYSVFVWWYVTLPCDLDFWPFDLNSCHTWRVTWPTLSPSMKTLRLFVHDYELERFPMIAIENAYAANAHAPNHVTRQ